MTLKVGVPHRVIEYYQICSNDDTGMTLTFFTARSNLVAFAFIWEKGIKTIVVFVIKVGRCSQLKLISTEGQGNSLTLVQIFQIQYF